MLGVFTIVSQKNKTYMCDISKLSLALVHCNLFPDYRASSLNIGLTSLIFLSRLASHPLVIAQPYDFHLLEDARPNALPPF